MSGFKLLAIIPLKSCDEKYRKNLKAGQVYQFYQSHIITLEEKGNGVASVIENKDYKVPKELYNLKNGISLNVSAVVGKNGTGKSTLFELLYLLIYLIGTRKDLNSKAGLNLRSKDLEGYLEDLKSDFEILKELKGFKKFSKFKETDFLKIYELINKYELPDFKSTDSILKLVEKLNTNLTEKISKAEDDIKKEQEDEKHIREKLAVSILYEVEGKIKEVNYCNKNLTIREFDNGVKREETDNTEIDLASFFYSISLNYSHHSLNSNTLGNWITRLFHKNDGYLTPVVINPMRDEGNFDINQELNLSKERLFGNILYNIIQKKDTLLLEKYKVSKFIFSLKPGYSKMELKRDDINFLRELVSGDLIKENVGIEKIPREISYWGVALDYLEKKISKIKKNYPSIIGNAPFKDFLKKDKSHITKKVRQTLNFLKGTLFDDYINIWQEKEEYKTLELEPKQIISWIGLFTDDITQLSPSDLTEFALPGFLNIDFVFVNEKTKVSNKKSKKGEGKGLKSDEMSSGEQQMLFNNNAILYHLYNLQSVFFSSDNTNRIEYQYVNIILDEMELYYHPEMQRQLLHTLITELEKINKNDKDIKGINIVLLTHSPFILSDIPPSNILKLKNGEAIENEQSTFAANIHDLLTDSFFLEDGFMGEYAKQTINQTIKWLNYEKLRVELKESKESKEQDSTYQTDEWITLKKNEIKLLEPEVKNTDPTYHKKIIELVDEPVLQAKLLEMYSEIDPNSNGEEINDEEAELKRRAEKLGYELSKKRKN
tara:strand:- start:4426 stop:6744 length:2319 start_codon:yes stop_codon:yes gene_type:complete